MFSLLIIPYHEPKKKKKNPYPFIYLLLYGQIINSHFVVRNNFKLLNTPSNFILVWNFGLEEVVVLCSLI